ncbi:MAG: TetR/AcrR family transcriptional regulator [Candidatus Eremiobacteraeota bacterium]|nr:TetR/AcrR family transcriptional regulator [Candidatus Eremiobacteraeota bacterium]
MASGPEALRLTEIAAKAGVSHPNVLYHFGSVAELQRQLAQRVAVRLASEIAAIYADDKGPNTPIDRGIAAVFAVFDERGFARLLAWLSLSRSKPTWEALGANLEILRAAIAEHPALSGGENEERRRRIVSVLELVIVSAVGYGLIGHTLEDLFAPDSRRPDVARFLGEIITAHAAQPR